MKLINQEMPNNNGVDTTSKRDIYIGKLTEPIGKPSYPKQGLNMHNIPINSNKDALI